MKKTKTNSAGELSNKITEVLEALLKGEISKAEETYRKLKKINLESEAEEREIIANQIKRLEKEIKFFKKKAKVKEIAETTTKAAGAVTGIFVIALFYLFLDGGITGFYAADPLNVAPALASMPDFHLDIGKEFTYVANADDPNRDNVVFSDDTRLFTISKNGLIRFTPTEEMQGIHYIAIIAKDKRGGVDLQIVKFVIGDVEEKVAVQTVEEPIIEEEIKIEEAVNETISETTTINETQAVNITLELNETEVNSTIIQNSSNPVNETLVIENITAIINQTINETD
ncbi:hypothetical protein ACFLZ6_01360 [Nanoarchaeota archaeon]